MTVLRPNFYLSNYWPKNMFIEATFRAPRGHFLGLNWVKPTHLKFALNILIIQIQNSITRRSQSHLFWGKYVYFFNGCLLLGNTSHMPSLNSYKDTCGRSKIFAKMSFAETYYWSPEAGLFNRQFSVTNDRVRLPLYTQIQFKSNRGWSALCLLVRAKCVRCPWLLA